MHIPRPRGAVTEVLFESLLTGSDLTATSIAPTDEADAALALWTLYELHHRGFDDVAEDREWDPDLLRLRAGLERDFEGRLRERWEGTPTVSFLDGFFDWVADQDGASVAAHVQRYASREEVDELLRLRSIYHLAESDTTAWVVPRLGVRSKAALMELQYDEYGAGDPNRLHHHLFARGLAASGLDDSYGAYIDEVPVEVLEQNNAMALFGLHRRLRGAALGHLAAFEATSSLPSRRMVQGLERLGYPDQLIAYYAEHVEADAVHEQLAVRTICGGLLEEESDLEADVWLGAFTCLDLEDRAARALLARWGADVQDVA